MSYNVLLSIEGTGNYVIALAEGSCAVNECNAKQPETNIQAQAVQLVVYEGQQLLCGLGTALVDGGQDAGDVGLGRGFQEREACLRL
jgi:hypothetical protein